MTSKCPCGTDRTGQDVICQWHIEVYIIQDAQWEAERAEREEMAYEEAMLNAAEDRALAGAYASCW